MTELVVLLQELQVHDTQHDHQGLRQVREKIVELFPDTEEAVEALYKIGLDMLFRERRLREATGIFETASTKKHPFWSAAARTSLGICYFHQNRTQKALFELRKVAYAKPISAHSITALSFIEHIFEMENRPEEVVRVRKDRIQQLEKIIDNCKERSAAHDRGFHLYTLGLALLDNNDKTQADGVLNEAKDLGPEILGADLYRSIVDALKF